MPKLSPISSKRLVRLLEKQGFNAIRQKGSHMRLVHPDGRKTSIPIHTGENIGIGLLRQILHDVNITREDFIKLR